MTKYFEVIRRDGPARLGKLFVEKTIQTPAIISKDDYLCKGSVFCFGSTEEAMEPAPTSNGNKKLVILPYVPSALHVEQLIELPIQELNGPKGIVVHPFYGKPASADVYVMGSAGSLKNPRDLIGAVVGVRNRIPSDTALYVPALATPSNLAFLVYLGIDLIDTTRVVADAYFGSSVIGRFRRAALQVSVLSEAGQRRRGCKDTGRPQCLGAGGRVGRSQGDGEERDHPGVCGTPSEGYP
jgi:archaeosine synthase